MGLNSFCRDPSTVPVGNALSQLIKNERKQLQQVSIIYTWKNTNIYSRTKLVAFVSWFPSLDENLMILFIF